MRSISISLLIPEGYIKSRSPTSVIRLQGITDYVSNAKPMRSIYYRS